MIETIYRSAANIPAPRTPQLLLPEDRGAKSCEWIDETWCNAQILGLELLWTRDHTLTVTNNNGEPGVVIDQWSKVGGQLPMPPGNIVSKLDNAHYRVRLSQQIVIPRGFVSLILPHPRFFDATPPYTYNDTPAVVPRVLNSDKSPEMIDLICRLPAPGAEHIFYAGLPICQLIVVPRGFINVRAMTAEETVTWVERLNELRKETNAAVV